MPRPSRNTALQHLSASFKVLFTTLLLVTSLAWAQPAPAANPAASRTLADAVTLPGVRRHMDALQRAADAHGGHRAAGTPGYAASVRYVRGALERAGYRVELQPFAVEVRETLAQTGRTVGAAAGAAKFAFAPLAMDGAPNTPSGGLEAPLSTPRDPLGCAPEDFAGTRGTIVLVARGTCTFAEKAQNAAAGGAAALLIYNSPSEGTDAPLLGSLGDAPTSSMLPTAGLSRAAGRALLARLERGEVAVRLDLRTLREVRRTANVLAELPGAEAAKVVMLGAHLDSVAAGPGINDNGSGVALVLELALKLAETEDADGVCFAFWGAEELGLLGSQHYVDTLSEAELERLRAYLNFDMVASPNAAPFAYGDPALVALFEASFAERTLPLLPETLGGASDHAPFDEAGVPVAGLFSGASGQKSAEEARTYGGEAGRPYDACYHQPCDTFAGTDTEVANRTLELLSAAAADALQRLLVDVAER